MNVETFFLDKNELLATLQSKFSPRISFASLKQTHSAKVLEVKDAANFDTPDADAFVTKLVDVALTIHTADCLPLLAYDTGEANMIVGTGKSVIGACHGGWRGVSKGIIKNWISALVSLGANAKNLKVLIGPSIGPCHFEVGADVAEQLYEVDGRRLSSEIIQKISRKHSDDNKIFIDLPKLAIHHLTLNGVKIKNISHKSDCTFCNEKKYFSYRRNQSEKGRLEAVILQTK